MLPNLAGLRFREHEGSFLVGAIAGLITRTKIVGFVGGMKIPLIRKFEAGYEAGVQHVCPTCRVMSRVRGHRAEGVRRSAARPGARGGAVRQGADVIFHAAGKTGDGVFAAARQRRRARSASTRDQFDAAPCCVVTSMVKRVDVAVVDVIKDVIAQQVPGRPARARARRAWRRCSSPTSATGSLLPIDVVAARQGARRGDHRRQDRGAATDDRHSATTRQARIRRCATC